MAEPEKRTYADGLRDAAALLEVPRAAILLAAGEMTGQEMRTVLAVLKWRARVIAGKAEENPKDVSEADRRAVWDAWVRLDSAISGLIASNMGNVSTRIALVELARQAVPDALAKVAPTTIPHMAAFLAQHPIGSKK